MVFAHTQEQHLTPAEQKCPKRQAEASTTSPAVWDIWVLNLIQSWSLMSICPIADDLEGTEAHPHVYFAEALTLPKPWKDSVVFYFTNKKKKKPPREKKKPPKDVIDTLSQLQRCLIPYVQQYRRRITF